MEDSFNQMDQLLRAWNLPQLCKVFREQEINIDALDALTDADIIELIPKVGPRAVFRKRLNEFFNTTQALLFEEHKETACIDETNDAQYLEVHEIEEGNQNYAEEMDLSNELIIGNEVEIANQMWTENNAAQETDIIEEHDATASEADDIDYLDEVIEELEAEKCKQEDFKDDANKQETKEKLMKIERADDSDNHLSSTQRFLNVEALLLSTDEGRAIIENYYLKPFISKHTRIYIADLIISEAFAKNFVLDRAKFEDIALQIIDLFPCEEMKSWFIPQNGSSRNSGGTLFNKYYTVYRKMRKTGFLEHYVEGVIKHTDTDANEGHTNNCIKPEQIDDEPEKLALKRAIPKYERLRHSCDFEKIHVKTLLESSFEGRGIMETYEKQLIFDVSTRNRLCKLIVLEAYRRNIKMRPRNFYDISCQIVELFPEEKIEQYFLPRGRTPPKGCLYHKYLYIKRRFRKLGAQIKKNENE